jgi:hypothetical protein
MNLLVDGIDHPLSFEPGMSVGTVLERVDADLAARERMIVSVSVDGREVSPEQLGEEFARSIDGVQTVRVRSEQTAALADRDLSAIEECIPELSQTVRDVAALFQEGKTDEGLDGCKRAAERWIEVVWSERRVADALQLNLDEFDVDDKPISTHHAELNQFLQDALRAMERDDYVLLGDLFEHELAPRLDTELRIVNALRRSLTDNLA